MLLSKICKKLFDAKLNLWLVNDFVMWKRKSKVITGINNPKVF